jgi:hypothetical protein
MQRFASFNRTRMQAMAERSRRQVLTLMVTTMAVSGLLVIGGFYAIVLPLRAADHARELAALWVGTFDNEAQVRAPANQALPAAERVERQRYVVRRVQVPALGEEVLLLQIWTGEDLSQLYRQRLVRFTGQVLSGRVRQETFSFNDGPGGRTPAPEELREVTMAALSSMGEACAPVWQRREDRRRREAVYIGTIAPLSCERRLRSGEAVFIEAETRLDANGLAHREAGTRADRSYVFGGGGEADFYRFERVRADKAGAP